MRTYQIIELPPNPDQENPPALVEVVLIDEKIKNRVILTGVSLDYARFAVEEWMRDVEGFTLEGS